jgi:hypothetical protein
MNYPLDLESMKLLGLPEHTKGEPWPSLPFFGTDSESVWIRWNNQDCHDVIGDPLEGDALMETVEYWSPSCHIEQAMRLWKKYPPKAQWLELQIGEDGWIVRLLYHAPEWARIGKTPNPFMTDDDLADSLPSGITEAWISAMKADK